MFVLEPLPYPTDALAPFISAETLELHHGKHHKSYVDKLNALVPEYATAIPDLEKIILDSFKDKSKQALFNNAAQCWNHEFLWASMAPGGGGLPTGAIASQIDARFGNFETFREAFVAAAVGHFGSGWIWLVLDSGALEIVTTHDADLPLAHGVASLLTCDLWEHAYYVDYRNRRPEYVEAFLSHLANWDFANANVTAADKTIVG